MVAVLALCLALQGELDADVLRRLGDADATVRDKATAVLKSLPFARAAELRGLVRTETDPEKRERLIAIVRHLSGKEAEVLYREGKLQESLLKLADAEGAADAAVEVERRTKAARECLLELFERYEPDGFIKIILYSSRDMESVQIHGRYALAPLIELLGGGARHGTHAYYFLTHFPNEDVIPALCGYLTGPERPSSVGVCHALGRLSGERSIAMLRSVRNDFSRSAELRAAAFDVLLSLPIYPEGVDPDTIDRLVQELGDEDVAVRDKAGAALKEKPWVLAADLRRRATAEIPAEKRDRLSAVVRHLVGREAEKLYQDGKLQESLLKLAEANGAAEPAEEVARSTRSAREFLVKQFALCDVPGDRKSVAPPGMDKLPSYGRYALPVLIEFLVGKHADHAFYILTHFPETDVVPALSGVLRGPEDIRSLIVCKALGQIIHPKSTRILTSIQNDPARSVELRDAAGRALKRLESSSD